MKRFLVLVAFFVFLVAALLSACSSGGGGNNEPVQGNVQLTGTVQVVGGSNQQQ